MSAITASTPYFYTEQLRSAFTANIARALNDGHILDGEFQPLENLLHPVLSASVTQPGLRVDRLIAEDGQQLSDELAGALLISHANGGSTRLYLDTLLYGLERFDDRNALLGALNRYTPSAAKPAFEYQLVESEPFEPRMRAIVDQQVEHLRQLAQCLQRIPALEAALAQSLRQNINRLMPDSAIDLALPLVQICRSDRGAVRLRVRNQTLVQAAVEILAGQPLPEHHYRSYLSARGQVIAATQGRLYDRLLVDAVKGMTVEYETLLGDYWQQPDAQGDTPRTLVALALATAFRQALLAANQSGTLAMSEFVVLGKLLHPTKRTSENAIHTQRLALIIGDQPPLKLVGMCLITGSPIGDLLLYSARHGLRRFATAQAMLDHFATAAGRTELQLHVSLNDLALMAGTGVMRIDPYDMEHPLFTDCADALIGLQRRNLAFVLGSTFGNVLSARAMIDDALDVSGLIDRRLSMFDGGGRWIEADVPFSQRWPLLPAAPETGAANRSSANLNPTWTEQIAALDKQVQWLNGAHPGIEVCARQRLNQYLALCDQPGLDASQIRLRWPEIGDAAEQTPAAVGSTSDTAITLVDLLLEKVSGHRASGVPDKAWVERLARDQVQATSFNRLSVAFINQMVERVAVRFHDEYLHQVQGFHSQPLRLANQQIVPATAVADFLQDALRLECELEERVHPNALEYVQMLEQVLSLPVRSLRDSLSDDIVEVYSVALEYADDQPAAPLSSLFILQRPLRTQSKVLCWSALRGMELFDSLEQVGHKLNRRLVANPGRELWLGLLSEDDSSKVRERLDQPKPSLMAFQYSRIDSHFIHALQQIEHRRQLNNVQRALQSAMRSTLSAQLLARLTSVAEQDERMSCLLDGLSKDIQAVVLQSMLPSWLQTASQVDLGAYVELLRRHYLTNDPADNFLASIPSLQDFARTRIVTHFNADYPGQMPDPDLITVTFTAYVSTPVAVGDTPSGIAAATLIKHESFTDFAVNHFNNVQGAILLVKLPDNLPIPQFVPPGYFKALVRELDIGQQYRTMLATRLGIGSDSYAVARRRFVAQMPSRMLLLALEMKMQKQLSARAFGYLQNVLDMPDSIARQADHDEDVTLRPMQLSAGTEMTPDPVAGVYLIGPRDVSKGPIVVHALFNQAFSFKEYASQAQLLGELRQPGSLQTLVLGRVDPLVRKRYDHGGFSEVHMQWSSEGFLDGPLSTPGPATLVGTPVVGNVLQYLFVETISLLNAICHKQTVTTAEADWKSFVYLMSLGVDQILSFVPGKLGMLLAAWQSKELFKASAASVDEGRWGRALSQVTAALGMLLTSGHSPENEQQANEHSINEQPSITSSKPVFSWKNSALTPQLKARLRAMEVSDITLSELHYDRLYNVYIDRKTLKQYAAVVGQVYEVTSTDSQWRIIGPDGRGPNIRLNAAQQWELNLSLGLMGGGGLVSRFESLQSSDSIDRVLMIEARGMGEIRALYQHRASMIVEAHVQARLYLENCLYNLVPDSVGGSIHGHTARKIADFFGIGWVPPRLIALIKRRATRLYLELTDPSLSSLVSHRFVVGSNKLGQEKTAAFVSMSDPQKRIYLTEGFFDTTDFPLKSDYLLHGSFNASAHYRAATLIHELSHLVNKTHDFAYLDSSLPFVDILDTSSPELKTIRDELHTLRTTALSHQTPASRLFRKNDPSGWRDITEKEGRTTVFKITQTTTLAAARTAFITDPRVRSEIMLSNADSLTMLIMELGRRRITPDLNADLSISSTE